VVFFLLETKKDASTKEEKYMTIVEKAPVGIYEIKFNPPRFEWVNEETSRILGYTREELLKMNPLEFLDEEGKRLFLERIKRNLAGEKVQPQAEFKIKTKDGKVLWASINATFTRKDGVVNGAFVAAYDITERKKAGEELEKSESLYKTLFEKTNDAFQLVEPIYDNEGNAVNYRIVEVNANYESQVGIKASAVKGKLVTAIDPNIEREWIETHAAVAETGKARRTEIYNDFSKRWYDLFLFPYGKGLVGVLFRDITERKKAEEAVRESEQLYRTLFENTEDGFQVVEPILDEGGNVCDFRYLSANPAFERQVGVKRSEILGKTAKQVFPAIEHYWIEMYSKVLREGKTLHYEDYFDAVKRWYHLFYFLFPSGKIGVLFRDITERKESEEALRRTEWIARQRAEELEKLQAELEEKAVEVEEYATRMEELAEERAKKLQDAERLAAIGATAGMVGHDIRNPLQSIVGDLYLIGCDAGELPEGEEKESIKESVASIRRNVEYIDKIVQDLQDYTRPLNPIAEDTNLEEIIQGLLLDASFPENIEAKYVLEEEAKEVVADPALLKRILQNLVNNAVQAMPEGGKLEIESRRENGEVAITVQDSGVGIPEDAKDKMFTPLFTTKAKGQGFGLPVVKRMTEALGGTVAFESEVGKGTKFIFRLPSSKNT
jgi:PAS domain S-box-containing protein